MCKAQILFLRHNSNEAGVSSYGQCSRLNRVKLLNANNNVRTVITQQVTFVAKVLFEMLYWPVLSLLSTATRELQVTVESSLPSQKSLLQFMECLS